MFGIAQRRGLGIDGALLLSCIGMAQDIQAFRVRGHHAVLDAVVDHLDEVACATGPAVQIAVFGGAADLLPAWRARSLVDARGQRGEDRFETLNDGFSPPIIRQ